ncbi:nickel-responsive transcriptional regulator NikR [Pararhizobium mangrovi]|uniref:Putative nickel-responsive regulator n=1 Tax=Pararhizobium mangrovi TaxID=2590452 RepID=A0A506TYU0_9HYPH|nr:nickel-responsive transcriptional regulator NikR [Pararhizobium mangrovi]TPW26660.1 nickel-responsive transcriptional regulator NikR [Pararhizobium mangrovi]
MQRITITMDDDLLAVVDTLKDRRGYASRSEVFRDVVRALGNREVTEGGESLCIATLSYVFDYATRELAQRLTRAQHEHHDLVVTNTRVPLDHSSCMELMVLRGPAAAVQAFSDTIATQRGVRHANLHLVPVRLSNDHSHEPGGVSHVHYEA